MNIFFTEKALKALFKGEAHGLNVSEALEDLKASVSEFETEANICDAERLGQIDRTTEETLSATKKTETGVQQLSQGEQTAVLLSFSMSSLN